MWHCCWTPKPESSKAQVIEVTTTADRGQQCQEDGRVEVSLGGDDVKASANPFGMLHDAVLLLILRDYCDQATQQAAYKSCKDIRDFCHRNMKSVTIDLRVQSVLESSSKAMCPKAAYGIRKVCICFAQYWGSHTYLRQLIIDTFEDPIHPAYRAGQLANVTTLALQQPSPRDIAADQRETVSRLLSHFVKLRSLHIDDSEALVWVSIPQLRKLICKKAVARQQLQQFASKHPKVRTLEMLSLIKSKLLQPLPSYFPALKHLHLGSAGSRPTLLPAGLLTGLARQSTLTLNNIMIYDANLLRKLHITQLQMRDVTLDEDKQQLLPPSEEWPALKSVKFMRAWSSKTPLTETLARAIMPLPHPGITVSWPRCITLHANVAPDPQFGYMAVAHMTAVDRLDLCGLYNNEALQTMVRHRANIRELHVSQGPLNLGQDDVATCLAIPSLRELRLQTLETDMPQEVFGQLFEQSPLLDVLVVPRICIPPEMQLPPLVDAVVEGHEMILCRQHVTFWNGIWPQHRAARRGLQM